MQDLDNIRNEKTKDTEAPRPEEESRSEDPKKGKAKRIAFRVLLGAVLLFGLMLRFAGFAENIHLHPDEASILDWMENMQYEKEFHHRLTMRPVITYPGGYFVLTTVAKFAFVRPVEWVGQRWDYFTRQSDHYRPISFGNTSNFGRACNAWMGMFTILFTAWAILYMTGSRLAALLGGLLAACEPFSIEHAHYLETDIAMLMTCALSLYATALYIRKRNFLTWAFAAFSIGFAIGTKYPLGLLVLPLFISLRLPESYGPRPFAHKLRWLFLMLASGGLIVFLGFAAASPDAVRVYEQLRAVQACAHAAWSETSLCVGESALEPFIQQRMNFANTIDFFKSVPLCHMALIVAGLVLTFCNRRYRKYWPVLFLYPALHLSFIIFKAPWSRSQEFLPIVPNLAFLAVLPFASGWTLRWKKARIATLAVAAIAVFFALRSGIAMSSQFGWEDTRRLVARDLQMSYPEEQGLACEKFSNYAETGLTDRLTKLSKYCRIPMSGPDSLPMPPYLMSNTRHFGRGVVHPATRKLYPSCEEKANYLKEKGVLLGSWGVLDSPVPMPTFRSPTMELWRTPESMPTTEDAPVELSVPLPRPVLVKESMTQNGGRETFFKGAPRVGVRKAMILDRMARQIAIGGPGDFNAETVYCVITTRERGASVVLEGFGRKGKTTLPPYSASVVPMRRPWYKPRFQRYERLTFYARETNPFVVYIPCFLQIAFTPEEAAVILLDDGHPAQAYSLLREMGDEAAEKPFWKAVGGQRDKLDEARELLLGWERIAADEELDGSEISEDGIPVNVWQEFAKIRLLPLHSTIRLDQKEVILQKILPIPDAPQELTFKPTATTVLDEGTAPIKLFDDERPVDSFHLSTNVAETTSYPIRPTSFSFLKYSMTATNRAPLVLQQMEYRWHWRDMLRFRIGQLKTALAAMDAPREAPPAVRFGDLLVLQGARQTQAGLELTLAPLQESLPPLVFQWKKERRGRWRNDGPGLRLPPCGGGREPFQVTLPLPSGGNQGKRHGLALESFVTYHAAAIPAKAADGSVREILTIPEITGLFE